MAPVPSPNETGKKNLFTVHHDNTRKSNSRNVCLWGCDPEIDIKSDTEPSSLPSLHLIQPSSHSTASLPGWRCGVLSSLIKCDSTDLSVAQQSQEDLLEQLKRFVELRCDAVEISLTCSTNPCLSRLLRSFAQKHRSCLPQIWFRISLSSDNKDTWLKWLFLRKSLEWSHCSAISIIFDLTDSSKAIPPEEMKRWMGESIAGIRIPSKFIENYEKISSRKTRLTMRDPGIKKLVLDLMGTGGQNFVVILDKLSVNSESQKRFVTELWTRRSENKYEEWLQGGRSTRENLYRPMQPLVEELPSAVYETFESDLVKYEQYRIAINQVLQSFVFILKNEPVIMVLGGGRGGLVKALLHVCREIKQCDFSPKIFVIEKNPNCIPGLNYLNDTQWNNNVIIINADMRSWSAPEKADLVISELLGGFSDNELSPECLDSAQHLMKDNCLSIPCWYRSFLLPVMSPRMINSMRRLVGGPQRVKQDVDILELGSATERGFYCDKLWVSRVYNRYIIDDTPAKLFTFRHPAKGGNTKYGMKEATFRSKLDCELSGFMGFLDVCLHESKDRKVYLSTIPKWQTPQMMSWYPTFIPLPVLVSKTFGET